MRVALTAASGEYHSILDVTDVYRVDLETVLEAWLGTVGLSPRDARRLFAHKGWRRVVAFHPRNVPHRVHEQIQLDALRRADADGLFISPVTGSGRTGDFRSGIVLRYYQQLLDSTDVYPRERVVLGCFATYPRHAGPSEAVFTALCRKNMGCSHFIVGRDNAGVGDTYASDASVRLFDSLDGIGIEIIAF